MGTDGERAALVSGHGLYTEEGGKGEEISSPPAEEMSEPEDILAQFHQDALTQVGVGRYHWFLGIIAGFCFMADGAQVFILPYITPSIQAGMCLEDEKVPWLNEATMIGLAIGAISCSLGDHMGRKTLLMLGLMIFTFSTMGAIFSPDFGIFVTVRLFSSIGLGICYPMACIYFAEFLPLNSRGKMSVLLLFWALGGLYVVFLAYIILPSSGEEVVYHLEDAMKNWPKVFIYSIFPATFALVFLTVAPESVRYLLHKGKDVNAIILYQQMYKRNASRSAQYQLTELELPRKVVSSKPPPSKTIWNKMINSVAEFFNTIKQFGLRENLIPMLLLSHTWAALGYSYYGMSAWVPQHIQNLRDADYFAEVKVTKDTEESECLYNYGLENVLFENVTFQACLFATTLSHVTFKNCTFNYTEFSGIHSSKTYFLDSTIENSKFYNTDFSEDRFINTRLINITYYSTKTPCRNDVDFRFRQNDLLRENLLRLITPFIALTVNCLCFHSISKYKIGVVSVLFCSLMSITRVFLTEEVTTLVFDFIWSIVILFAFNAVNVITVEAFPVHLRATGFGICFAWFRVFGLLSSMAVQLTLPTTFCFLMIGGIALIRMQDTSFNLI